MFVTKKKYQRLEHEFRAALASRDREIGRIYAELNSVRPFARHRHDCAIYRPMSSSQPAWECSCGFDAMQQFFFAGDSGVSQQNEDGNWVPAKPLRILEKPELSAHGWDCGIHMHKTEAEAKHCIVKDNCPKCGETHLWTCAEWKDFCEKAAKQ